MPPLRQSRADPSMVQGDWVVGVCGGVDLGEFSVGEISMAACEEVVMSEIPTRDKRATNHMDPETRVIHARLEAWGAWAKDAEIRAWPVTSIAGRMDGGRSTKPPIAMPDEIAAVDAAVCRLCAIDKRAIQLYYIRWQPLEVHARKMGMRVRQYQNVLRRARWRLAMFMNLL